MLSPLPPPNVSVITVTYHTGPVLFDMITSVLKQAEALELILVNNGNPPEVIEKIKELAKSDTRIRLVESGGNVGFASACNRGAKEAKGDYLFFLNPDCILPLGQLTAFLRESAARARPHMISGRIVDENRVEQSGSRREHLTPWQALSEIFKVYKMFPDIPHLKRFNHHDEPVPEATVPMPATSGAVMFFPKDDFWMLNGFDTDYFLHVEDLDICLRLARAGGTVYFMPAPAITHIGGTSDAPKVQVELWKTQSFQKYFFKNFTREYPEWFLWLVVAAAWVRFGLMAVKVYVELAKAKLKKFIKPPAV